MTQRTTRLIVVTAALVLLGLFWLSVWHGMDHSVLSRAPILDEAHYLQRAVAITDHRWMPETPFIMSPLYSYLVAATGSGRLLDQHGIRIGGPPVGIRCLQALLWAATAVLLWQVGRNLFGHRWGWGPPLLWLGYAPTAILAGQVLMEIPLTFVATLALAVSGSHVGQQAPFRRAVLAGALVGAAFLLRGTTIVLILPVILALTQGMSQGSWHTSLHGWRLAVLPVLLATALVVLPFVALNSWLAGHPAPPAMSGGVNLYIGNGPLANGFFVPFEGYDVEHDPSGANYLSRKLGRAVPDALAADRIWMDEAYKAMRADPVRVMGLWLRKVRLHLVGVEIPQISAIGAWLPYVPLLRALIVPWALLAAAGLAGGILCWRRYLALRPWLVAALLMIAVQSLFFVVTRYRVILVPSLTLATIGLAREIARRRGRELALACTVMALATLAVWPWGLAETLQGFRAGGLDNEAVRWELVAAADLDPNQAARYLAEAKKLYRRSLGVADDRADAWRGLARVLWATGNPAAAIEQLTSGLAQVNHPNELRRDLIGMLIHQGRLQEALTHLGTALEEAPQDVEILHSLTLVLDGLGRFEEATLAARRLVTAHPDEPRSYLDLGVALSRAGQLREAERVFIAGLERFPDHLELKRDLDGVRQLLAGPDVPSQGDER